MLCRFCSPSLLSGASSTGIPVGRCGGTASRYAESAESGFTSETRESFPSATSRRLSARGTSWSVSRATPIPSQLLVRHRGRNGEPQASPEGVGHEHEYEREQEVHGLERPCPVAPGHLQHEAEKEVVARRLAVEPPEAFGEPVPEELRVDVLHRRGQLTLVEADAEAVDHCPRRAPGSDEHELRSPVGPEPARGFHEIAFLRSRGASERASTAKSATTTRSRATTSHDSSAESSWTRAG